MTIKSDFIKRIEKNRTRLSSKNMQYSCCKNNDEIPMTLTFKQLSARHRYATTWPSMKVHAVMGWFVADAMSRLKYLSS